MESRVKPNYPLTPRIVTGHVGGSIRQPSFAVSAHFFCMSARTFGHVGTCFLHVGGSFLQIVHFHIRPTPSPSFFLSFSSSSSSSWNPFLSLQVCRGAFLFISTLMFCMSASTFGMSACTFWHVGGSSFHFFTCQFAQLPLPHSS